jgi:hypothetical protein
LSEVASGPVSVRTDSGSNSVCRKCFCAPTSKVTSAATSGANRVTTFNRDPMASCSAVTSLAPVNSFGPAATMASQSNRSTIRIEP